MERNWNKYSDIVGEEIAGTNTGEDTTIGTELDQDEDGVGRGGEEIMVVLTIVKYLSESIILAIEAK